jgi:glycosyltransferase involved in cell wall biosynthesis
LQEQVIFHAGVTDQELSWLYANCEILIAPSSIEGFGLPVAEALQCGAPVVCSDIPAFREVAGNAAQYFDLYTSSPAIAMADAAAVAIQAPTKWTEASGRFSADSAAAQHISLYSKLLTTYQSRTDAEVSAVERAIRYGRYPG